MLTHTENVYTQHSPCYFVGFQVNILDIIRLMSPVSSVFSYINLLLGSDTLKPSSQCYRSSNICNPKPSDSLPQSIPVLCRAGSLLPTPQRFHLIVLIAACQWENGLYTEKPADCQKLSRFNKPSTSK